jgi:hypothetical protein
MNGLSFHLITFSFSKLCGIYVLRIAFIVRMEDPFLGGKAAEA